MDPLRTLNLPRDHSLEQLRYNYKVLARQLHPDKARGKFSPDQANAAFQVLTEAYKALLEAHRNGTYRAVGPGGLRSGEHDQLRDAFRDAEERAQQRRPAHVALGGQDPNTRFDADRFNAVFSSDRVADGVRDGGYGEWMARSDPNDATEVANNRQVVRWKEPDPTSLCVKGRGAIQFTELGVEKVDDYSRTDVARHAVQYTDYRVAHTTARIVDPRVEGERESFASVEDLQKKRAGVRYAMNEREAAEAAEAAKKKDKDERRRVKAQGRIDDQLEQHFERMHRALLGQGPAATYER